MYDLLLILRSFFFWLQENNRKELHMPISRFHIEIYTYSFFPECFQWITWKAERARFWINSSSRWNWWRIATQNSRFVGNTTTNNANGQKKPRLQRISQSDPWRMEEQISLPNPMGKPIYFDDTYCQEGQRGNFFYTIFVHLVFFISISTYWDQTKCLAKQKKIAKLV